MFMGRAESNNTAVHRRSINKTVIGKILITCAEYEMVFHLHDKAVYMLKTNPYLVRTRESYALARNQIS